MNDAIRIEVAPCAVARSLGLAAAFLAAGSFGMQMYRLASGQAQIPGLAWVTLDGEHNLPALFSTLLLLIASALLLLVARLARDGRRGDVSRWLILSAGFFLMGLDESLSLHERLIDPMRSLLGGGQLGIFFFAWVVPAIVLAGAVGLFFLPFVFRLPRRTAIAFVVSGALYLGGALGVELIEGWWREGHGHTNVMYHVLVTLEECLEMTGVIYFIHALLTHVATSFGDVQLRMRSAESSAAPAGTAAQPTGSLAGAVSGQPRS